MPIKPVYQNDVDAYLRLYRKFLEFQYDEMTIAFKTLPTFTIESIFSSTNIHENEDRLYIDFGFDQVEEISDNFKKLSKFQSEGKLEGYLSFFGDNVNSKEIGVRKN